MYTYNLFALVCIHSHCLCTRLCNIGVLFHLYMYIQYITYNRSAHVCTHVCWSSWLFACLHLAPPVSMYLCLSASGISHFHLFLLGTTCFCLPALVWCVSSISAPGTTCLCMSTLVCIWHHSFSL